MIKNFKDINGIFVNSDSSISKESQWRLVRRFFLVDTKSGIAKPEDYMKGGDNPMIMRYAKSITLRIKLDPENEEMIFSPLLIVNYRERTKDNVNL